MATPLRVGIVSANWGMVAHLPAWHAIEGVEVRAVCTSRRETAEAAARTFGIERAYWDAAEMAADPDLDIIDVGTRPDLRRDMVLAAIAHRKHVFAAANFAADIGAAREMRDAARVVGVVTALDSTIAQAPAHRRAKELIAEGMLGRPVSVATRLNMPLFHGPAPVGDHWRWFAKRAHGASALRNLGTHSLHLLVDLLGPIEAVTALGVIAMPEWRFPNGDVIVPEVEDSAHLLLRFANGVIGTVAVSWATPALVGWRMELSGDHGTIVTRAPGNYFPSGVGVELLTGADAQPLAREDLPSRLLASPDLEFPEDGRFPPQTPDIARVMLSLVRAIREGGSASPDFERAYHVEAVIEAARLAIDGRRWVTIEEVG